MNDYFPWYALAVAFSQAFVLSWLYFLGKSRGKPTPDTVITRETLLLIWIRDHGGTSAASFAAYRPELGTQEEILKTFKLLQAQGFVSITGSKCSLTDLGRTQVRAKIQHLQDFLKPYKDGL